MHKFLLLSSLLYLANGFSITCQLTQVNSIFFNLTGTSTQEISVYAEYFPIGGQPGSTAALISKDSDKSLNPYIPLGHLYALSTYQYNVYEKDTTHPILCSG